jgi:DNA-binding transcriptional LysR family regulator
VSHPLARRRRIGLADLSGQRFILREPGSGTRMAVDAHFRREKFRPDLRLELGSNEAIREAVAGNLGVAVLSRHALPADPQANGVVLLPVRGFPIASKWHIVYPKGRQLSPIAAEFERHLLLQARQWSPWPDPG